jgi:hypothetical protein
LAEHHKKKVILLIDEYDAPFNSILFQELSETKKEKKERFHEDRINIMNMISSMLTRIFKENENL